MPVGGCYRLGLRVAEWTKGPGSPVVLDSGGRVMEQETTMFNSQVGGSLRSTVKDLPFAPPSSLVRAHSQRDSRGVIRYRTLPYLARDSVPQSASLWNGVQTSR